MDKETDAFRTISEVAEDLDVPKHVLRFWEVKFPQIRPMKRGGGRRYYRPEDLDLLRGIRHLLHAEGYTIKGVQKILREQGIDQVKRSWRERGASISRRSTTAAGGQASQVSIAASPPSRFVRKGNGLGQATPNELKARIEKIVLELQSCRALLTETPRTEGVVRRPRRAQAGE